jgi:hypothetical protein
MHSLKPIAVTQYLQTNTATQLGLKYADQN